MTSSHPPPTDAQLLRSYVANHDDLAFAAIVRKHGPMVFGVCRRVAGRWHDAEDAFQATFLVLASKAETVCPPSRLGAWLHGVAVRCALKARQLARTADVPLPDLPLPELPVVEPDLVPLLDEALAAIPAQYRAAVVLCHLQGRTRTEAAQELGWTEGTLSGRLHRAMELLAKRLTARGVTATSTAVLTMVSARTATATVPAKLYASTNDAATLLCAGVPGDSPSAVTTLAQGVIQTMTFRKLKLTACLLLVCVGIGAVAIENLAGAPPENPRTLVRRNAPVPAETKQTWKFGIEVRHEAAITAVALSKDGIVSADEASGSHIQVSDVTTGKSVNPHRLPGGGVPSTDNPVRLMRILNDEKTLFFVFSDSTVWKRDLSAKESTATGAGPGKMRYAGFSGDGKRWLVLPELVPDAAIIMDGWHDAEIPKCKDYTIRDPQKRRILLAALSADDTRIATANEDAILRVYDRATNKEIRMIALDRGTVLTALKLSNDGKKLAVVGERRFAKLFDTTTGKELGELKLQDHSVTAIAFTPDGNDLAMANGKEVHVFDATTCKRLAEIKGHTDDVTALAYSLDGKRLVTGSKDKTAKVWERK